MWEQVTGSEMVVLSVAQEWQKRVGTLCNGTFTVNGGSGDVVCVWGYCSPGKGLGNPGRELFYVSKLS